MYWNQRRHPFKWGERKRHRQRSKALAPIPMFWKHRQPVRHPGIAIVPNVA
jgi:hypothetical protein